MQKKLRPMLLVLIAAVMAIPATASAAGETATASAGEIVVRGTFIRLSADTLTVTYSSPKGKFSATWIGVRHFRLSGNILGRRLSGKFRTRQASSGTRYRARGLGRLGARRVRIRGGGPNDLSTARLVLSWPV